MRWFRKRQYEELILQIGGWEKVKVPRECKHDYCLSCEGLSDFAYCTSCGLRTPSVPHKNGAWAESMFIRSGNEGTLSRDVSNLRKLYCIDRETGEISPTLAYAYGESKKKRKESLHHAATS